MMEIVFRPDPGMGSFHYPHHKHMGRFNGVNVYRYVWADTPKNLSYIEKRKQLAEKASAELGVTCFG